MVYSTCCVCNFKPLKGDKKVSCYKIPCNDPHRAQKWLQFIRRALGDDTWEPTSSSKVCSQHFEASNFEHNSAISLAESFISRNFLTRTAVPSIITKVLKIVDQPISKSKQSCKRGTSATKKTDARFTNYEICEVRSQLAGKDVELNKMVKQMEEQKNDFIKQSWEEKKKFDFQIKAVIAERDRLKMHLERQHNKLKRTQLDKQVAQMKLRESQNEIRRLKALLKGVEGEKKPSNKKDTIDTMFDAPNTSTTWSSDSD